MKILILGLLLTSPLLAIEDREWRVGETITNKTKTKEYYLEKKIKNNVFIGKDDSGKEFYIKHLADYTIISQWKFEQAHCNAQNLINQFPESFHFVSKIYANESFGVELYGPALETKWRSTTVVEKLEGEGITSFVNRLKTNEDPKLFKKLIQIIKDNLENVAAFAKHDMVLGDLHAGNIIIQDNNDHIKVKFFDFDSLERIGNPQSPVMHAIACSIEEVDNNILPISDVCSLSLTIKRYFDFDTPPP